MNVNKFEFEWHNLTLTLCVSVCFFLYVLLFFAALMVHRLGDMLPTERLEKWRKDRFRLIDATLFQFSEATVASH